jgi:hypothetical protein
LDSWARMVAVYLRAQAEIEEADELWFAGPQQLLLPMSALLLYTSHDDTPITPATLALSALTAAEEDDDIDPMLLLTLPRAGRPVERDPPGVGDSGCHHADRRRG